MTTADAYAASDQLAGPVPTTVASSSVEYKSTVSKMANINATIKDSGLNLANVGVPNANGEFMKFRKFFYVNVL